MPENNDFLQQCKAELEDCRKTWIDLPAYCYTDEYEKALLAFCARRTYAKARNLIIQTLHHETGDRLPYFDFDGRKKTTAGTAVK